MRRKSVGQRLKEPLLVVSHDREREGKRGMPLSDTSELTLSSLFGDFSFAFDPLSDKTTRSSYTKGHVSLS